MEIRGKKILIVGFGKSGQAAARYCLAQGAVVTVTDVKLSSSFDLSSVVSRQSSVTSQTDDRRLTTYFGSHPPHIFEEADIIVASPGVPLNLPVLGKAKERKIPIIGEFELADIKAEIIAITGTNGKSTVTTLIGEILKEAGKKVMVGGNLGTPLLEMLEQSSAVSRQSSVADDRRPTTDFVVLEISSYQLEISPSFHPHVAVLLNITPDHLDRYPSYETYIEAKALITKNQTSNDCFVFNKDDPIVRKIAESTMAKKIGFSVGSVVAKLASLNFSRATLPTGRQCSAAANDIIDLSRAKIEGLHNKENMIAAALAANAVGIGFDVSQKVFERFKGLPHRNQFVRELCGVKFFDDSKGTNVGAVIKSLEGFNTNVILIAGGLDKGGSYNPLRPLIKEKVKALILIGSASETIRKALGDMTETVMAKDMASAVEEAAKRAKRGDVVLLSPACASFDMFKDYADRGDKFIEEVMKI